MMSLKQVINFKQDKIKSVSWIKRRNYVYAKYIKTRLLSLENIRKDV